MVGVVYNPILEEMFSAITGRGATCNDKPIKASTSITGIYILMNHSFVVTFLNSVPTSYTYTSQAESEQLVAIKHIL